MEPLTLEVGDGICLRQFLPEDVDAYFQLVEESREHLIQAGSDMPEKYQIRQDLYKSIAQPKNPGRLRLGIWFGDTLVGGINLEPSENNKKMAEVGYWIGVRYKGKGYVTRALMRLIAYAFTETSLQGLYACVKRANNPSRAVLVRAGFTKPVIVIPGRLYYKYKLGKTTWLSHPTKASRKTLHSLTSRGKGLDHGKRSVDR